MAEHVCVLVVEDSAADAELIAFELEQSGYDIFVERVQTGPEMRSALEVGAWDVIVCDYRLPSFGCMEALEVLRDSGGDVPLIVVSGVIGEEAAVATMRAGARDCVMKQNLSRLGPVIKRELSESDIRRRHRAAEEALRESRERLRLVVEAARLGTWDWHIPTGTLFWSGALERLHGLEPGAFRGTVGAFLECVHSEDRRAVLQAIDSAVVEGGEYEAEFRTVWPDGTVRWLAERGRAFLDTRTEIERLVAVSLDVTERKRAGEKRRKGEELLGDLISNFPGAMYRCALDDARTMQFISGAIEDFTGYPAADFLEGRVTLGSIIHADDRPEVLRFLRADAAARTSFALEYRIVRSDGNVRWLNEFGRASGTAKEGVHRLEGALFDVSQDVCQALGTALPSRGAVGRQTSDSSGTRSTTSSRAPSLRLGE